MGLRAVKQITGSVRTVEGGGFVVRRPFPTAELPQIDPFLLFDHMGPIVSSPGEAKGAPDHPHRGFETVTYLLQGSMQHEDSAGHRGSLQAGDVQWMTAGRGVVHAEMPSAALLEHGGTLEGIQLWVNLRAQDKMVAPRYQDTPAGAIPVVEAPGLRVKIIAGEALGARAVIETRTPMHYLHVQLTGRSFTQPVPDGWNAMVYVRKGGGAFGPDRVPAAEGDLLVFRNGHGDVLMEAGDAPFAEPALDALVLAGQPLHEPVARYGPFVMNTRREILEAFEDFEAGRLGRIERDDR